MLLEIWMTSCPESMGPWILGEFWKKAVSWDLKLDEASWFSNLGEARPVESTRCAARGGVRWNSQHSKNCTSLSLCSCWKLKSQEGNKSFVPEIPRVVSVSSVSWFLCKWTFYRSVYFTHQYTCIFCISVSWSYPEYITYVTITHTRIRTYPHTLIHLQPRVNFHTKCQRSFVWIPKEFLTHICSGVHPWWPTLFAQLVAVRRVCGDSLRKPVAWT